RLAGRFVASYDAKLAGLVVKLLCERIRQLVEDGIGEPFARPGRSSANGSRSAPSKATSGARCSPKPSTSPERAWPSSATCVRYPAASPWRLDSADVSVDSFLIG